MRSTNAQARASEADKDISIRDLLAPLFRRKKTIAITFAAVFCLFLLYSAWKGPSYSSQMEILVNRERLDPLVSTEATTQMIQNSTPVQPEEVNSEIELLTSRDVLEQVVIQNGLDQPHKGFSLGNLLHPHDTRQDRIARAVKGLAKQLKISVTTKTNVIQVSFSSGDPQLCYGVLHSLGEFYTAKHVAVHRPAGSYEFFVRETNRYQGELAQAEAKLRDFSKKNGVAAPDVQRTNLALQVAESVGLQHVAEQAIAADQQRIQNDRAQMQGMPQRSATVQQTAAADRLLEDLNTNLIAAQTKRTQLTLKYDPSYPLVQEVDQEIAQIQAAITQAKNTQYVTQSTDRDPTYELLREDVAKSETDLAAQRASLAATKRSIQSIEGQMVDLDQKSIAQTDLMREVKADEDNYLLYLSKREQERTTDALDNTRIANVAIAVPPAIPVLPVLSWPKIVVIAFGIALILSIVMAYAVDYLDSSFHTPAEVIDILGIPVVITVAKKTA